ncbi:vacuolar protein sorting-associated protein 13B isoform X2 [Contarinia nasturtii]|uniref:vacuolar protein sorting-associated protein 13B isoform X2 n=1 Tax=Contarinia nasturtii TaxID=265458 RepID=UPI0012D4133F|nr:vacuolar protein sorting-associated protein 13B isoform X2 [Contarinia nasturtii]
MFKIESYISPIIINYIDKYVKDFRPQNAQVSLWGGEVSFQNLDIRLDVLQEELHLPLNIVSGHIHELTVRVPWTKIASEPIQINVNTIEFVVKLKSGDGEKKERDDAKPPQSPQIAQEPPGYMATLINKIANNISIKLNNIIFKYIEDDIVLSMNIQMLSIDSADDNWNPAFVDINPVKVMLKKVININDLTICLDKRNAQGKIDVCQEPILYRCSLQARMIRKYNLTTAHLDSITRIDIFTENIDFKISVQQFPMLIRMYLLVQMLREFHTNLHGARRTGQDTTTGSGQTVDYIDGSYTTWIWNMLPELFPASIEEERLDSQGHIFHNGFYAKNINITIKSQEVVANSIIQTNTVYKYHPILKITLSGVSFDAISIGKKWTNVKGGISYIGVFPLGNCTCGKKLNLPTIFLSGHKSKADSETFLSDSLKDPNKNVSPPLLYECDFQSHLLRFTEATLLATTPALSIDIVNYRHTMDDTRSYGTHSIGSGDHDLVTEEYFMRIFFGKFNLKIDTSLLHLYNTLNDQCQQYTYVAPYLAANRTEMLSQLTPPSTDDYESLLDCIPLRKCCVYLNKSTIEYYHLNGDHFQSNELNDFKQMPCLMFNVSRAEFGVTMPLYPEKLINTTCQLPDPTEKLKENCFNRYGAVIEQTSLDIVYNKKRFQLFSMSNFKLNYDTLIQPELWKMIRMQNYTYQLMVSRIELTFNKPQYLLFAQLFGACTKNGICADIPVKYIKTFHAIDMCQSNLPKIELCMVNGEASVIFIDNVLGVRGSVGAIVGFAHSPHELDTFNPNDAYKGKSIFFSNEHFESNLFECTVQYPIHTQKIKHPPIVNIELQKLIVSFDSLLHQFLSYELPFGNSTVSTMSDEKAQKKVRKSSKVSKPLLRTESVHSNSITTMSIVTSATRTKEHTDQQRFIEWYEYIKQTIVYINAQSMTIVCPNKCLYMEQETSTLKHLIDAEKHILMTCFRLPSLAIQTTKFKNIQSVLKANFPIDLTENWMLGVNSFPWNIELNDFICFTVINNDQRIFLPNVNTKLTLDLTKKENTGGTVIGEEMSFVIHLDTTPIRLNLDSAQIKQIYGSLNILLLRKSKKKQPNTVIDVPAQFYDTQINDFFCETTNSERSSEDVISNIDKNVSKIHCLLQWTITKFTLSLNDSTTHTNNVELLIDLEDIIVSIDKQSAYTKAKAKFGSINGMRKMKNKITGEIDVLNMISRSDALTVESQETFLEVVATMAVASNVHSRWGTSATKKVMGFRNDIDTITEILITMQSIDLKLESDVLSVILSINDEMCSVNSLSDRNECDVDNATVYCVRDLPLLFFDCKGLQLWLPNTNGEIATESNVLIVKMNAITIAPSVENPVIRKPVREDIYVKAAQLRMINTPGSIIEDRQYELLLKNVSVFTGNWDEILQFTCPANNENPAFDWNNQTEKPSLNINTIFNDCVLSVIYAPAIVFQNIVVCGQALEINCISDLCLNLTLNDIELLNDLRLKFSNVFRQQTIESTCIPAKRQRMDKCTTHFRTINDQFDNHLSDSGFKSNCYHDKRKSNEKLSTQKIDIPHMLSFVGGAFTVQLYNKIVQHQNIPLMAVQMMQPNFYCVHESAETMERLSLFNLTLKMHNQKVWEQSDIIFDTHKSELDETGISPALIEFQRVICRTDNDNDIKVQCNVRKPIQIKLTPTSVENLFGFKETMEHVFYKDRIINSQVNERPILHLNNIKEIRKLIGGPNSIEFNMTKISINFMTSMDRVVSLSLFKWNNKISVHERMKQITYSTNIDSVSVNTQNSMLLNPTSMTFECALSQEKWSKRLVISTNFTSNIIHLQINPNDFWTFAKVQLDFWSCINRCFNATNQHAKEKECHLHQNKPEYNAEHLNSYELPRIAPSNSRTNEEYFQDDLRLGTFEYIISNGDNSLPSPYQIYLLNSGADMQICWRYPHPRTINFIQIYPIPGQFDVNMKCQLEYFQESHNTFFPYVTFVIGNKKSHEVKLPKQKLTASVWRIVLIESMDATTFIEPDETNPLQDFLSPRTIISFIRIDSIFNVENVPKLQANFKVNKITMSILNSCVNVQSCPPEILSKYTLKVEEHTDVTQEFCQINFGSINVNINVYGDMLAKVYNEFTFGINIFDSSYLNVIPLIDTVSIGSFIEFSTDNRPNVIHLTADKLSMKYGPAAGCAIATAKSVWQNTPIEIQMPIMSRLVICNSMSASVKFGQDSTEETIWLQTNECFYYAFRTEKSPQKLRFSIKSENSIVEVSEAFSLNDTNEMKMLNVATNKMLLVTTRKLSTTQKQVIIKGQIELMNMTNESFQIHYKDKTKLQYMDAENSNTNPSVILMTSMGNGSFFDACDDSCDAYIRLQLVHENANGWSGEIPLGKPTSNIPWLVKVPLKTDQKYATFSVRIHTEYIGERISGKLQAKRILIILWPFFTVRSLLPMHINIQDKENNKLYTIDGKGTCTDLQIAGTFDTEHTFALNLGSENKEINELILTYKNIDKRSFFSVPVHFKTINDIIKELEKPNELKWPCRFEKELNIDRKASHEISSAPICKFSASRSLSCAMELNVIPPCLIINNLGFDIFIVEPTNEKECCVQSNYMTIPMTITSGFYIKFQCHDEWITMPKIRLTEEKNVSRHTSYYLPDNGSTIVAEKIGTNHFAKFCLTAINENNSKILSIQSHFVLCNFSKYHLKFHAFCIHRNEKLSYDDIIRSLLEKSTPLSMLNNNQTTDNIFKGCGCTVFCDISQKTYKSLNNMKDLNYYIVIGSDDNFSNCAPPILINKPITRTAFGLQYNETNISLAASVNQHNDQLYISVYEDRYPFIEIDNQTNILIFVAEADFADFSKSLKPKKSIHDENFQWCCTIPSYGRMNFAPPSVNERFPEKHNSNVHLIFGCANSGGDIKWSIPVETNKQDEKYLALPLYGDIKLTSYSVNKTVKILLEHIDFKKEFNVKVVHTKLSSPNSSNNNSDLINDSIDAKNCATELQRIRQSNKVNFSSKTIIHNFIANIFIKEVNFVLYDDDKENLCIKNNIASIFFDDFIVRYVEEERKLEFGFGNIQVDNNLYSTGKYDFPVILCSQNESKVNSKNFKGADIIDKTKPNANPSERSSSSTTTTSPTSFSLPLMHEQLFENHIGHFKILLEDTEFSAKEIICSMQPLRVYIEDKFIAALLDFAIENLPSNVVYIPDSNDRVELNGGEVLIPKIISEQILSFFSEPLRLNRLCIKPLSILLSVHTCIRMYIALDHSPLHFAQFEYKNIYTTTMRLGYNIGMHYVSDAIFGAGWVVGSLEILGSPSGLARSVSTGLWDFVSMPVQGLMRGPWGVLLGITYGSASLIKNITAGTVNSVTKLAASVARNLDRLTLDDEHLERTEAIRRMRPSSITHGISQGLTGFGINLLGAVGGIARHALEAKSSVEVFTGLGKGIIGVVTKPISGAAEFLALTGQGVLHTVGFNAMPISRDIATSNECQTPMCLTKVAWKILSKIDYNDSVLWVAFATVQEKDKLSDVTVAITTKLILLILDSDNELATVLPISRTRAIIDPNDATSLILANKSDDDSQQFHRQRILQYLSKTQVQSTESRSKLEEDNQMNYVNDAKRNVLLCKDSQTAIYLAKYIQFLYYCLNTNQN